MPFSDPGIGTVIGPYRLVAELGSGGMGTVFRGVVDGPAPLPPGERVAIKFLHAHLSENAVLLRRFEIEAEIGQRIDHPNVVRTYATGIASHAGRNIPYLVMEYVEGQTLRLLLTELGQVPEELCRRVGGEVATGLAAIHAAGAIHRDLKPENVLITSGQAVKLMDFGVARLADAIGISQTGSFVGSLLYAAPEQLRQEGDLDGRLDLHALGLILYELATGRHPFATSTDIASAQLIRRLMEEIPRPLGELNPQSSAFFEELVQTLLAKDCERRFPSARDLAETLASGEDSSWWKERARTLRSVTRRPLRRVRIPRDASLHGRGSELERLKSLYARASQGHGQVVLVEGEAGIGKTRLVDEFVNRLNGEGEDLSFLFGSFPPGGAATAAGAFAAAYREHLGTENLEEVLAPYLASTPLLIPAFSALLRGDARPPGAVAFTQDSLQSAFIQVTRKLARERTTVILMDDLHFAPDDGRGLFTALALAVPNERVLLIGTCRPGLPQAWLADLAREGHVTRLPIGRLATQELTELLVEALGGAEGVARELSPEISLKTDGNPFFLFEILRGLRQAEFLRPTPDGKWVRSGNLPAIEVPLSVKELIELRIGGLAEVDREILEMAACAGFAFDPLLVADALSVPQIRLLKSLAQLERSHRLIRAAGREYVFDHHQIQEALYAQLPELVRESYHAALAQSLEGRSGAADHDPGQLEGATRVMLCEHFLRGRQGERALRYLESALDHLEERYESGALLALAERALQLKDVLLGRDRIRVLLRKCRVLETLARTAEQEAVLTEALDLAEQVEDPILRGRVRSTLGRLFWRLTRYEEACSVLNEALYMARDVGDRQGEGTALHNLGIVLHELGRHKEARDYLERHVELTQEIGDRRHETTARGSLAIVLRDLELYEEARSQSERQLAIASAIGDRRNKTIAHGTLGSVLRELGHLEEAYQSFEQGHVLACELGDRRVEASTSGNLGLILVDLGRYQNARTHIQHQLELAQEGRDRRSVINGTGNLGALDIALGHYAEALEQMERCLAASREIGQWRAEAEARIYLAQIFTRLGAFERSREVIGDNRVGKAIGTRWVARALLERGMIEEEDDDSAAAESSYREALGLFREGGFRLGVRPGLVALGALLARIGRSDEARAAFHEVISISAKSGSSNERVLAATYLAVLEPGERETNIQFFTDHAVHLGLHQKMTGWHLLWRATRDVTHLEKAHRLLVYFHEHAPEEYRSSLLERVRLHCDVLADWRTMAAAPDKISEVAQAGPFQGDLAVTRYVSGRGPETTADESASSD